MTARRIIAQCVDFMAWEAVTDWIRGLRGERFALQVHIAISSTKQTLAPLAPRAFASTRCAFKDAFVLTFALQDRQGDENA